LPLAIARLRLLDGITTWARITNSGMSRLSWTSLIKALAADVVLSTALSRVASADDREQIADLEVSLPVFVGLVVGELSLEGCDVVALIRNSSPVSTFHDTALEKGDVLILI